MTNLLAVPAPSRKRATVIQAIGGYVNTGIVIIQGLLLVPLYLHFIGSHMYGLWLASGGILAMMGLVNFGISSLVIQRIASAYGQNDLSKAGSYFINGVVLYICICLLYGVLAWLVSIWLPEILKIPGEDSELLRQCFQLAIVAMMIGIFNECLRSFAQALLRPILPMVSMAVGRILGIGGTVWLLFDGFGLWALPVGMLIAESVIFILNLFYSFSLFYKLAASVRLDRNIIKEYMHTSPALLMARMGDTLSQESEPLLITIFLTPEITTAYIVTRRAADIVFRMLSVIVGATMGPFSHLAGSGDREKIARVAKSVLTLSFSLGVIGFATYIAANYIFVSLWVGEPLAMKQNVIFFIGLGFLNRSFRGVIGKILYGLGDFIHTSMIILLEGVARVVMVIGLISTLGVIGIPIALAFSCLITSFLLIFRLKKRLMLTIDISVISRLLFTAIALFSVSLGLIEMGASINSWNGFIVHLTILIIIVSTIYTLINWASVRETYKNIFT